jgi:hypothetical protein
MAIPAAIRAHFNDTIQVKTVTNHDAYGNPVYADAITLPARLTYREVKMATSTGEQYMTAMRIYTQDVTGFTSDAEIVLEDGSEWTVKGFNRPAWPDGTRHLRIDI